MQLNFNLSFSDLFSETGLANLDAAFLKFLLQQDKEAQHQLQQARHNKEISSAQIIALSYYLEEFLAKLFGNINENEKLRQQHQKYANIFRCRRNFIARHVARQYKTAPNIADITIDISDYAELADNILFWLDNESKFSAELEQAGRFCAYQLYNNNPHPLFTLPANLNYACLLQDNSPKQREGFDLTDNGHELDYALTQSKYCLFCHKRDKDSCRKGLTNQNNEIAVNPLGNNLNGCPLDQKISEMNLVKSQGYSIAALAIITIDNPMVAATGHRICNDCSKACIFQKQEPVDIPQIETRILKDVLTLPYGCEIYWLLTRWNPLKAKDFLPKSDSNNKIMVVGIGPAGFGLSHYLLQEGHNVVAIDGTKTEPLEFDYMQPIKDCDQIFHKLSQWPQYGFGGVAEYGITARWQKNFLKLIRIMLQRHRNFRIYSGIRFGSNINIEQIWQLGFEHIALCMGAGKPNNLTIKNSMAKGIKIAADFLMALQLTKAAHPDAFNKPIIRLPIAVIGAGLTAIDAATEAQAYYLTQIEQFLSNNMLVLQ